MRERCIKRLFEPAAIWMRSDDLLLAVRNLETIEDALEQMRYS